MDVIADSYRDASVKNAERNKKVKTSKINVKSVKSIIPLDFNSFLCNGENKKQLIVIVFDYILQKKIMCLQPLNANIIMLSRDGEGQEITSTLTKRSELLSSNQEKADTKVILHTLRALE